MATDSIIERKYRKIENADGLRGFAVLFVLIFHSFGIIMPELSHYSDRIGAFGVMIFFVLSSFLLSKKISDSSFNTKELIKYFVGRFFRIYPLFTICCLFYLYLNFYDYSKMKEILLLNGTYQHLWTIPLEFKFYLILPLFVFIVSFASNAIGTKFALCCLFLLGASIFFFKVSVSGYIDYIWTPVLMMGVGVYLIYESDKKISLGWQSDVLVMLFLIAIYMLAPAAQDFIFGGHINFTPELVIAWGIVISALCYFSIKNNGVTGAVLKSKMFVCMGRWSFSIYLFHWAVMVLVGRNVDNKAFAFVFAIVASIVFGAAVFRFIESPIEKFRHNLTCRLFKNNIKAISNE